MILAKAGSSPVRHPQSQKARKGVWPAYRRLEGVRATREISVTGNTAASKTVNCGFESYISRLWLRVTENASPSYGGGWWFESTRSH